MGQEKCKTIRQMFMDSMLSHLPYHLTLCFLFNMHCLGVILHCMSTVLAEYRMEI
jgi:hypothetical protein